jgi:hypothetical protein
MYGRIVKIRKERMYSRKRDGLYLIQFPIVPAIAISIDKSQGCTFEKVVLHPENCDRPYQLYVACSRVKGIEGLRLTSPILPQNMKTDPLCGKILQEVRQTPVKVQRDNRVNILF